MAMALPSLESAPRFYRWTVAGFRFVIRRWFRKVEVTGLENIPADGGGILVSWHPNGMVDPGLIVTHFPRQVVFGARDGLFKVPLLGWIMRGMGTIPIFRSMDGGQLSPEERQEANARSLDALADQVAHGTFSCLFPEGDSHDAPHLMQLKTGAARFYYRALQLQQRPDPPVIIPVGLHYDSKRSFRSNALISFHPPLTLPEALAALPTPEEPRELARERYRALTGCIESVLRDVVHATESWELHHLIHRCRTLVRAERAHRAGMDPGKVGIFERTLGFARVWQGYHQRLQTHPEEVHLMRERIHEYNEDLRALGIEDHELDRSPRLASPWLVAILLWQVLLVFLLMPPLLFVGYIVNLPAVVALWVASKVFAKRKKDEASIKVLLGLVLLPLSWAGAAALGWWGSTELHMLFPNIPDTPWLASLILVGFGILGGMLAMRYLRLAGETMRAVRVRLTRRRRRTALERLRKERSEIHDAVMDLMEGLELPGRVREDGRVVLE